MAKIATFRSAIRAHANFAEYVPIIVIMNALLEIGGAASAQMHVLLGTLTVSRILHPFGMHAKPMTPQFIVGRIVGMILTFLVLVASALLLCAASRSLRASRVTVPAMLLAALTS